MPLSAGFIEFIAEQLAGFGPIEIKRMFGGASIGRDGVGFGILDDDVFFIKADPEFAAELKGRGSKPWAYSVKKDGSVRDIAYWSLPDSAADDPDETSDLARRSLVVARLAAAQKPAKKAKTAVKAAAGKPSAGKDRKPPAPTKTIAKRPARSKK